MTSISLLDNITHTKRRHTFLRPVLSCGPSAILTKKSDDPPLRTDATDDLDPGTSDWVIAGAATTPLSSLLWDSCQLKMHISEGRAQMKALEKKIFSEEEVWALRGTLLAYPPLSLPYVALRLTSGYRV